MIRPVILALDDDAEVLNAIGPDLRVTIERHPFGHTVRLPASATIFSVEAG